MGGGASVVYEEQENEVSGRLASEEACDECGYANAASTCSQCSKIMCLDCCPHRHNALFDAKCVMFSDKQIICTDKKKLLKLEAKCGTFDVKRKRLTVLCEFYYQDKYCKCCTETTEWQSCSIMGHKIKFGAISKRVHECDKSFKFVGDMCLCKGTQRSFFTFPCTKSVYELEAPGDFRLTFETDGSCFGIASLDNGLALSMEITSNFKTESAWQVRYYDFEGNLKQQIYCDDDGKSYFSSPKYLCSNQKEDLLFVSDSNKHSVMVFDTLGQLVRRLTDGKLTVPLGLACDDLENLYVACGTKVVQIEKDGKAYKMLLAVVSPERVLDVCFDTERKHLFFLQKSGKFTEFSMIQPVKVKIPKTARSH